MLPIRDRTTLFLSPLVESIATRAIQHADTIIGPRLGQARRNLDAVDAWVARHDDLLTWRRPDGGVCGLLDLRGASDTYALCRDLVEQTGVLLVPGRAFDCPSSVRIGYGGDGADLNEGLRLLSEFLRRRRAC
jgi:aspartate/methionine/tyrosine aminotransferase